MINIAAVCCVSLYYKRGSEQRFMQKQLYESDWNVTRENNLNVSSKYASLDNLSILSGTNKLMYDYWHEIGKLPDYEIRNVMNLLYPYVEYDDYKVRNILFDHTKFVNRTSIQTNDLNDFPDKSYHWLNTSSQSKEDVLFGTFWTQNELYKHQNPDTCDGKTFYLLPDWPSGLGSCIHQIGQYMRYAFNQGYIVAYHPATKYYWAHPGEFCEEKKNYDCYFEPLTNCTINFSNPKQRIVNGELNHIIGLKSNPPFSDKAAAESPIYPKYFLDYWMAQATAYIMRPNARLRAYFEHVEKKDIINYQHNDISMHIRLSDKESEMKLVSEKQYHEVLDIIRRSLGKESLNVFVSSELESVISYFMCVDDYSISYMNYTREHFDIIISIHSTGVALSSFANLKASVESDMTIGTWGSNWFRLLFELRNTVGYRTNNLHIEVGDRECISFPHCKHLSMKTWKNTTFNY